MTLGNDIRNLFFDVSNENKYYQENVDFNPKENQGYDNIYLLTREIP